MKQLGVATLGMALAWALSLLGDGPQQPAAAAPAQPLAVAAAVETHTIPPPPRAPALPSGRLQPVAAAEAPPDEHPHPITTEHRRLQRELQLIAAMNDALDRQDAQALRGLLERYAQHDPEDTQGLQQGYRQLADCLEHLDAATKETARAYYDRERASVLRRYIRRTCLEHDHW